jgi:hypothetical protein
MCYIIPIVILINGFFFFNNYRLNVAYRYRDQAIDKVSEMNHEDVDNTYANVGYTQRDIWELELRMNKRWDKFHSYSADKMIWELTKWKYDDFYPKGFFELEE